MPVPSYRQMPKGTCLSSAGIAFRLGGWPALPSRQRLEPRWQKLNVQYKWQRIEYDEQLENHFARGSTRPPPLGRGSKLPLGLGVPVVSPLPYPSAMGSQASDIPSAFASNLGRTPQAPHDGSLRGFRQMLNISGPDANATARLEPAERGV